MSNHNPNNESCPLNDPETFCNPVLAGLECECCPCVDETKVTVELMHFKTITIATCDKSWHQAIYVDGEHMTDDSSLYANIVAEYAGSEPVYVRQVIVELDGDSFPDLLSELKEVEQ